MDYAKEARRFITEAENASDWLVERVHENPRYEKFARNFAALQCEAWCDQIKAGLAHVLEHTHAGRALLDANKRIQTEAYEHHNVFMTLATRLPQEDAPFKIQLTMTLAQTVTFIAATPESSRSFEQITSEQKEVLLEFLRLYHDLQKQQLLHNADMQKQHFLQNAINPSEAELQAIVRASMDGLRSTRAVSRETSAPNSELN